MHLLMISCITNDSLLIKIELSSDDISKKWSKWDEPAIDRFRVEFQMIDINEDGLIDFTELYVRIDNVST